MPLNTCVGYRTIFDFLVYFSGFWVYNLVVEWLKLSKMIFEN